MAQYYSNILKIFALRTHKIFTHYPFERLSSQFLYTVSLSGVCSKCPFSVPDNGILDNRALAAYSLAFLA
jgi:hypothetical protein